MDRLPELLCTLLVVLLRVSRLLDCLLRSEALLQVQLDVLPLVIRLLVFLLTLVALLLSLDLLHLEAHLLDSLLLGLLLCQEPMSILPSSRLAPHPWSTMRSTSLTDCQSLSLKRS